MAADAPCSAADAEAPHTSHNLNQQTMQSFATLLTEGAAPAGFTQLVTSVDNSHIGVVLHLSGMELHVRRCPEHHRGLKHPSTCGLYSLQPSSRHQASTGESLQPHSTCSGAHVHSDLCLLGAPRLVPCLRPLQLRSAIRVCGGSARPPTTASVLCVRLRLALQSRLNTCQGLHVTVQQGLAVGCTTVTCSRRLHNAAPAKQTPPNNTPVSCNSILQQTIC
jgi:hypothetical protein